MKVTQSIIINRNQEDIFEFLRYTENQGLFGVWSLSDPNIKKTFTGNSGEVGSMYAWESEVKNVGVGTQKNVRLEFPELIETELVFEQPIEGIMRALFILEPQDDMTQVNWVIESPMKFPASLFSFFIKRKLEKDLMTGLRNLKKILEIQS